MTEFGALPDFMQAAVLITLFLLLFFQFFSFCIVFRSAADKAGPLVNAAMAAVSLVLLCFLTEGRWAVINGQAGSEAVLRSQNIPAAFVALFIAMAGASAAVMLHRGLVRRRTMITKDSIKESADNLPVGLCFAKPGGQVLLANSRMEELSHMLTGRSMQDEDAFWSCVNTGELEEGSRRIVLEELPSIITANGDVWSFSRRKIKSDGSDVIQLTAAGTTELYELVCKLREENGILDSMNERLRKYGETVEEMTRTQERLATKVRIHDEIGQDLMATRYFLMRGAEEKNLHGIIEKWRKSVAVLKREVRPGEYTGVIKYLTDAARSAGVDVAVDGELPEEGTVMELIVAAGAEALTNAVRHAGAKQLRISVREMPFIYVVEFTNDGSAPDSPIREGGGLSSLRSRVESAGGVMSVTVESGFKLRVTIPKEGRSSI